MLETENNPESLPGNAYKCISTSGHCQFSERFLQIIWNEKMLQPELHCTDGTRLRIISGGSWNVSAGPDFLHAVLLFNDALVRGDIEVHRQSADWYRHGHQEDPQYRQVILHLVWEDHLLPGQAALPCKTLVLADAIMPHWQRFLSDIDELFYPYSRQFSTGGCALRWAMNDNAKVQEFLQQAAQARFASKTLYLQLCGAQSGLDQALYEEVFAGLGYAENREPFRKLAAGANLKMLRAFPQRRQREAILLGLAGFLPDPTRTNVLPHFQNILRQYWRLWWESGLQPLALSWKKLSGRPYNSCQRRLIAGLLWLEQTDFQPAAWLNNISARASTPKELLQMLCDWPAGPPEWQHSRDFCHSLKIPAALLGQNRARDLTVNVLLPAIAAWSKDQPDSCRDRPKMALQAWLAMPRIQDNHLLKEACHRFLMPPSRAKEVLTTAAHQQGMMDIYQNFCLALHNDCDNCPCTVTPGREEPRTCLDKKPDSTP